MKISFLDFILECIVISSLVFGITYSIITIRGDSSPTGVFQNIWILNYIWSIIRDPFYSPVYVFLKLFNVTSYEYLPFSAAAAITYTFFGLVYNLVAKMLELNFIRSLILAIVYYGIIIGICYFAVN